MTELEEIFVELGLNQYLDTFVEHGFDTWDTILDITESDFDALGVKLGHRRKLQRRIANSRGYSTDQALTSPTRATPVEDKQSEDNRVLVLKTDAQDGGTGNVGKRKYRRHPKPDENAPERPPSAYVIFSNKMRVDLKGRHLSFTEIAKLVGENWQNLSPKEKEPFEGQAFAAKGKYNAELGEYKKTENYRKYSAYLHDFKEKQASQRQVVDSAKRPKLEHQVSTGSSGAGSSGESQKGIDGSTSATRGTASGPMDTSRFSSGGRHSPPNTLSSLPNMNPSHSLGGAATAGAQGSPNAPQSTILPGYRDSIFGTAHQQTLAWRDSRRGSDSTSPQFPRIMNLNERRPARPASSNMEFTVPFGTRSQNDRRTGSSFSPPPLLTSESTAGTTGSNSSSSHHMPRTPMEPSLDRSLPLSAAYPSKSYENQLPPLRSISLSPQSSIEVTYNSPSGVIAMDYPSGPPRRNYFPSSQPQTASITAGDYINPLIKPIPAEEVLDPVSALLKADEIVNRTNRNCPPP